MGKRWSGWLRKGVGAVIAPVVLLAAGCEPPATGDEAVPADQAVVMTPSDQLILASAKVALPPEGLSPADLPDPESAGAQELQHFCTACHALPSPAAHSATDWPAVVRRMWLRMGRMEGYTVPMPETGDRIIMLQYLMDNALKVSGANLPDAPGRDRFEAVCGQCHELPDPKQHSAADWLVVVRRMGTHMSDLLGQELTGEDLQTVVQYLEGASM